MTLPPRVKDLTGKQFGSLTAIRLHHMQEPKNTAYWEYLCICGNKHVARGNTVTLHAKRAKHPSIPSCGCKSITMQTKHGYRYHPLYSVYKSMRERCYTTTSPAYSQYGAKGVTICNEWLNNPKAFIEWGMANGWKHGLQIDKDILCKAKGIYPMVYSPETCQWVTPKVNVSAATSRTNYGNHPNIKLSQNQVDIILHMYFSKQMNGVELAKKYNVDPSTIYRIIRIAKNSKG